jgi:protein-L-isoaspartate(D-aspartate) O-methyltransferase
MTDLGAQRQFFAEEIQATSNLMSLALVEALASVPREHFLPPGPWTIRGEADFQSPPRQTPDDDPRHVYHNLAIAIDPARTLFNGAPGLIAKAIDTTGTGYYTALIAHCIGSTGRVFGLEVDETLAAAARNTLASMPWAEVHHGNGTSLPCESFDAMLINAGVTHPEGVWLDALRPGGRMILPLTATMPGMNTIGKGPLLAITRAADDVSYSARVVTFVAIYSAIDLRDDGLNSELGKTLAKNPFPTLKALRRDAHEPASACWLHGSGFCLST